MKIKIPADKTWVLLVVILFGIVYQLSGTLVYVEGDDASSIAYHLMGRDDNLQPPYSPYHGMMDKVLGIFPPQEDLLRVVALGTTRIANILMVILILFLTFDWLNKKISPVWRAIFSVVVLLAVPEIFYFGLVYSPTMIAMCFVLLTHLVLRMSYRNPTSASNHHRSLSYGAALILFGLGVAFRWNVVTYGLVITVDLMIIQPASEHFRNRLITATVWGVFALLSSFLMINLSGYGFSDFIEKSGTIKYVINQAGTLNFEAGTSYKEILMRSVLTLSPMFSPIFSLIILGGIIKLVRNRDRMGFIFLAGFLGIVPWLQSGVPKFIITILPVLIFTFAFGLESLKITSGKNAEETYLLLLLFWG
jgi:hypothetical protein